uniref:Uncharacterized protein n=1 Tax=Anguilla anguilla TaxID=7936 RepID=A0A0E9WCH0_ANGAN
MWGFCPLFSAHDYPRNVSSSPRSAPPRHKLFNMIGPLLYPLQRSPRWYNPGIKNIKIIVLFFL